jgi:hypothetical protein
MLWRRLRASLLTTPMKRKADSGDADCRMQQQMNFDLLYIMIPGCAQNEKVLLSR